MRSAASIEFSTQLHGKTVHWARNWLAALATRQASVLDLHQRQEAGMLVVKRSLISLDFHISADPKGGFTMAGIYDDDAHRILFGPHGSGTQGTWLSLAALTFALSGCAGWLTPDNAGSGFIGVSENQIKRDLSGETNRTISDPSVGLVAYMTGYDSYPGFLGPDRTYYAFSGIAPGYDTGAVVTGGTATYDAQYGYLVIDDIYDGWFGISGTRYSGYGSINLTADFDAGTLSGAASGLTVDGAISGSKLSGTVAILFDTGTTPESIKGVMTGYIGDTGTIGAFHANDDDTAAAGGFVGTVN